MHKTTDYGKVDLDPYFENDQNEEELKSYYDAIKLPTRSTPGAAGYDFYSPFKFRMEPGTTVKIPTGIRVDINENWWLLLCPKSGLGFKYHIHLANTIGVDDSDYYYSDNTGHIFIKMVMPNDAPAGHRVFNEHSSDTITYWRPDLFGKSIATEIPDELIIEQGEKFAQGVFLPYGITRDDHLYEKKQRTGGEGSTGRF